MPVKAWRSSHPCGVCGTTITRHEHDTDRTYSSREVCSRACMRRLKGSQAQRGKLRWVDEGRRWDAWSRQISGRQEWARTPPGRVPCGRLAWSERVKEIRA